MLEFPMHLYNLLEILHRNRLIDSCIFKGYDGSNQLHRIKLSARSSLGVVSVSRKSYIAPLLRTTKPFSTDCRWWPICRCTSQCNREACRFDCVEKASTMPHNGELIDFYSTGSESTFFNLLMFFKCYETTSESFCKFSNCCTCMYLPVEKLSLHRRQ